MLESLKILLKKHRQGRSREIAGQFMSSSTMQKAEAEPKPADGGGGGGGFGFIKLNATMPGTDMKATTQVPDNDQSEDLQVGDESGNTIGEPEDAVAARSIDQICRYSHKILRKYVVSGMIDLVDGP